MTIDPAAVKQLYRSVCVPPAMMPTKQQLSNLIGETLGDQLDKQFGDELFADIVKLAESTLDDSAGTSAANRAFRAKGRADDLASKFADKLKTADSIVTVPEPEPVDGARLAERAFTGEDDAAFDERKAIEAERARLGIR